MKRLIDVLNEGYLKGSTVDLLSDIDVDIDDTDLTITTKTVNTLEDGKVVRFTKIINNYINNDVMPNNIDELRAEINNPNNYAKYYGLISASNKYELADIIKKTMGLFGNDGNFNWIDVSAIDDMSHLIKLNYTLSILIFNGHIELWDVSNVENMSAMFAYASEFN
jgi:hypothetical protein